MRRDKFLLIAIVLLASVSVAAQQHGGQTAPTSSAPNNNNAASQQIRDATREKMRVLLEKSGPGLNVAFRLSEKQPYNFVGVLKGGLKNADSLEIVILVSSQETIHFRIYPHYNGAYVNINKVQNSEGLMRRLLVFSDKNFLYWGADDSGDVFAGYNFTLEAGFPEASIKVVLESIPRLDGYVGQMRPDVDGSSGQ